MQKNLIPILLGLIAVIAIVAGVFQTNRLATRDTELLNAQETVTQQVAESNAEATANSVAATEARAAALAEQTEAVEAAQNTDATAQAEALNVASNEAATAQAQALTDAENAASTAQAQALTDAENAASTAQAQAVEDTSSDAATAQAQALTDAENAASTAQAQALTDAENTAATAQAQALEQANHDAATAQAQAVTRAESVAATAQAQALTDANDTAATAVAALEIEHSNQLSLANNAGATADAQYALAEATIEAQQNRVATLQAPLVFTDEPLANVDVGRLIYRETFERNSRWWTGSVEGAGSISLEDGQYALNVRSNADNIQIASLPIVRDGYMEVEADLSQCADSAFVGILFRTQQDYTGYLLVMNCALNFWTIVAYEEDGSRQLAINAFTHPETPDDTHTFGVLGQEDTMAFYLDGILLGTVADEGFTEGTIGFYLETVNQRSVVRFDNLRVWNVERLTGDILNPVDITRATPTPAPEDNGIETTIAGTVPQTAADFVEVGHRNLDAHNLQVAVRNFDDAIRLDPNLLDAYLGRGTAHLRLLRYDLAIFDFNDAVDIDSNSIEAYVGRAKALAAQYELDAALDDLNEALDIDSDALAALNTRGFLYFLQGDSSRGVRDFRSVVDTADSLLTRNPDDVAILLERGIAFFWLFLNEQAVDDFSRVLELDPNNGEAYLYRARTQDIAGEYELALSDFELALEHTALPIWVYYYRGVAHRNADNHLEAIDDFTTAIELRNEAGLGSDPEIILTYYNRAESYIAVGRYLAAVEDYNEAITVAEANPDSAIGTVLNLAALDQLHVGRSIAHSYNGDTDSALVDINTAIDLDAEDPVYYLVRGRIYANLEQYDDALADYNEAINLDDEFALAYAERGVLHADMGNTDDAIADLETYGEMAGDNPNRYYLDLLNDLRD